MAVYYHEVSPRQRTEDEIAKIVKDLTTVDQYHLEGVLLMRLSQDVHTVKPRCWHIYVQHKGSIRMQSYMDEHVARAKFEHVRGEIISALLVAQPINLSKLL